MRFDELDLEDEILDGLDDMNFQEMTPVQEHTIPVILEGRDIIGCAQTGTGKTAAYTLPLLNRLLIEGNEDNVIKSVIIVPTRELAQQIDQQFQGFSYYLPVSTTVVYGGGDGKGWDVQKRGMLMGSDVVIATPGRMISHIQNSGIDLSHVECLILDEADRMLDMGFSEDIMKIVSYMPKDRQTIMFSATLPPKIREMARTILRNPAEVNIAISKPNEAIDQSAYVCYENQKLGIIREMFAEPTDSKTIIFSSSKLKVKELAHTLKRMKLNVAAMHSDLEQAQREEVMLDFKNNKVSILVATDIVARGIDIEDIGLVINYDVPHDPEDYIHRIGRTARAAATGSAVTFVSEDEQGKFHAIEKFIERDIRKAELPASVGAGPVYNPAVNNGRGRGGRGGGEVCCNAGFAELVDDAIEPAEVPAIFLRLDAVPAEDGEGNRVDAGFLHEAHVVVPRFFRPLVGIVVAAECDSTAVFRQQFRPRKRLAIGGCGECSGCGGYGGFAGMNLHVIAFPNVFGTTVYHLIFLILDTFAILSNPDIRMYLRSTATGWHSLAISYAHLRSTGARLAESPSFDIAFRTHPDESQFSARRERKRVVQDGRTPPSAHGTTKRDEIVRRERKASPSKIGIVGK